MFFHLFSTCQRRERRKQPIAKRLNAVWSAEETSLRTTCWHIFPFCSFSFFNFSRAQSYWWINVFTTHSTFTIRLAVLARSDDYRKRTRMHHSNFANNVSEAAAVALVCPSIDAAQMSEKDCHSIFYVYWTSTIDAVSWPVLFLNLLAIWRAASIVGFQLCLAAMQSQLCAVPV